MRLGQRNVIESCAARFMFRLFVNGHVVDSRDLGVSFWGGRIISNLNLG